jgi:hypothetical protein
MAKYDRLRDYLAGCSGEVTVRFKDLDKLIPGGLAPSASQDARWWMNDDPSHSHSRSWGAAGFTAHPDIGRGLVSFRPKS